VHDVWNHKGAESWFLSLWVLGTWIFAGFLNWTVNARSILPLIPAVCILLFRRLEMVPAIFPPRAQTAALASGLVFAGALTLWITASDVALANIAREAAAQVYVRTQAERARVFFLGHWGFQYYMQALGFTPADDLNPRFQLGDVVVIPSNSIQYADYPPGDDSQRLEFLPGKGVTTVNPFLGAGFYSSYWGPLPYTFGRVPPEIYYLHRVTSLRRSPPSTEP
jgi:hypothetical protein